MKGNSIKEVTTLIFYKYQSDFMCPKDGKTLGFLSSVHNENIAAGDDGKPALSYSATVPRGRE